MEAKMMHNRNSTNSLIAAELGEQAGAASAPVSSSDNCAIRSRWILAATRVSVFLRAAILFAGALFFVASQLNAAELHLQLTNPLDKDRGEEIVEIPLQQIAQRFHIDEAKLNSQISIIATAEPGDRLIPTQLYSSDGGTANTLLLLVNLKANATETIAFRFKPAGKDDTTSEAGTPLVFGREAPERKDDFAWENELVTYRVYGPALEATGEIASGIDVWSKRVPNFVIDSFYKRDLQGIREHNPLLSYHKDNGQGLDSYFVGPTRGCGGTGVWEDGKLIVSKNYTTMKILSSGPIRFAFRVTYAPWQAADHQVEETKTITLDAGTHMNKIVSTYVFDGHGSLSLAAGIAIHDGADASIVRGGSQPGSIVSVWDTPQDPAAGRIATGLVVLPDQNATSLVAASHALMIFNRHSGEPFTYFAGAGWSKADMPTETAWNEYLESFLKREEHPISVLWTKR